MKKAFFIFVSTIILLMLAAHFMFLWNPFDRLNAGTIVVDDQTRKFYYYVPASLSEQSGLIFVLHGSDMKAQTMRMVTGKQFDKFANKYKNMIVVYPQGYRKFWNDCRKEATYDAKILRINDVDFFKGMIKYFAQEYKISAKAVFAAGYSNGGHMCFRLAREAPDFFKGFAVISANLPVSENNECDEQVIPVSMLIINGTADPINPYLGGEVEVGDGQRRGAVISTNETFAYWRKLANCDRTDTIALMHKSQPTPLDSVVQYMACSIETNKCVSLIRINGGGHNIPNPKFFLWPKKKVGPANKEINAPEIIYDFFANRID